MRAPQTSQKSSLAESWPAGHAVIAYPPPWPVDSFGSHWWQNMRSERKTPGLSIHTERKTQVSGRAVGAIGVGRSADFRSPHRYRSTAAAALRPSAMAQTISD
jgi:hypothetical protein